MIGHGQSSNRSKRRFDPTCPTLTPLSGQGVSHISSILQCFIPVLTAVTPDHRKRIHGGDETGTMQQAQWRESSEGNIGILGSMESVGSAAHTGKVASRWASISHRIGLRPDLTHLDAADTDPPPSDEQRFLPSRSQSNCWEFEHIRGKRVSGPATRSRDRTGTQSQRTQPNCSNIGVETVTKQKPRLYLHGDQMEEDPARWFCQRCDAFVSEAHFADEKHGNIRLSNHEKYLDSKKRLPVYMENTRQRWRRPIHLPNCLARPI